MVSNKNNLPKGSDSRTLRSKSETIKKEKTRSKKRSNQSAPNSKNKESDSDSEENTKSHYSDLESNNNEDYKKSKLTTKEKELLKKLKRFFVNTKAGKKLEELLVKKKFKIKKSKNKKKYKKISQRVFDWFVTNYCKKNTIVFQAPSAPNPDKKIPFNVFDNYKEQLKAYSKQYFDPFNRTTKIQFVYYQKKGETKQIETTICQLNFFKWIIYHKIYRYIQKNFDDISKDMRKSSDRQAKISKEFLEKMKEENDSDSFSEKKFRKPRQKLSKNNSHGLIHYNVERQFDFND